MLPRFVRILLVTPPMVQFNTVYPAVPTLAAFLKSRGYPTAQEDLSLALALRLYSPGGLRAVLQDLRGKAETQSMSPAVHHLLRHGDRLLEILPDLVAFLQNPSPSKAASFVGPRSLPEGPRFKALRDIPLEDDLVSRAIYRSSLVLDEIADAVRDGIDRRFELARYAEHLAADAASIDPLEKALSRRPTLLDGWMDECADVACATHEPDLVGFTIPFPGTLYAAFRLARRMKTCRPHLKTVLGGGYVNTELRDLAEPRLFHTFDYVTYDDGEIPLLRIVESLQGQPVRLLRTAVCQNGKVCHLTDPEAPVLRHRDRPAPDFTPLRTAGYLAMAESPNPMHRLWTLRRWIKLTLAHGCYWHRCAFCDTSLDYIRRYDPADASTVVNWMEQAIADTGLNGFHFVDEAAPPALLGHLAEEIKKRGIQVEWWANIRFERQFTPALALRLRQAGCLAVSGGLECAHDRLLALQTKGLDTATAKAAMAALSGAGIMVHAYLMYGYPSQTFEETLMALDFVRSLFAAGHVQSAFFHRFALTVHSPAFQDAKKLRLRILDPRQGAFSRNEIPFTDPSQDDPAPIGEGLRRAIYNFMHGVGLENDVRSWFDLAKFERRPRGQEHPPMKPAKARTHR